MHEHEEDRRKRGEVCAICGSDFRPYVCASCGKRHEHRILCQACHWRIVHEEKTEREARPGNGVASVSPRRRPADGYGNRRARRMKEFSAHGALYPVRQSPGDLMAIPISDLVYKLDMRVRRALRWLDLAQSETDPDRLREIRAGIRREDTLLHAAATALRTRAGEASRFATSVGIECPAEMVRKAPHLCACALVKHIMGPEYGKEA